MAQRPIYILHSNHSVNDRTAILTNCQYYHVTTNLSAMYRFLLTLSSQRPNDLQSYSKFEKDFKKDPLYRYRVNGVIYTIKKVYLNTREAYPHCFQ